MTELSELIVERRGDLVWLTIARPRAANSINDAVTRGIVDGLALAASDDTVSAVILTGGGDKVFCAGRDLKNPYQLDPQALARVRREESIAYNEALMKFDKPLIAALNGAAIGAGMMLALHADQVVAVDHADLSLPEIDIGIATFLGHALVAARAGNALANDLLLTGRKIGAVEARDRSLVDAVVVPERLRGEAERRARLLGAKPRQTFRAAKSWILRQRRAAVRAAYAAHDELDAADPGR